MKTLLTLVEAAILTACTSTGTTTVKKIPNACHVYAVAAAQKLLVENHVPAKVMTMTFADGSKHAVTAYAHNGGVYIYDPTVTKGSTLIGPGPLWNAPSEIQQMNPYAKPIAGVWMDN
ncbi:hypothetical protein TSACC_22954 [Terrimicrobium sacchariphilum]|uniref:Transglutaminase-like domain-containing protein n=1 Tax=Terrimicrobium sacchariphilum TaxID=690879 RepID=A0A146GA59_TERSA|nr:transglutaminase-like domain-containing protein [Terrimicrobium sacchariphilum]GAT34529.1 hypothetical protein TSACC_22954 [Terrimicrobium sacchariphilum]